MRSSPSATDPLAPGPAGFAHRGLHSGAAAPENSLAAFAAALEIGAGIECDLRLSADNRILVFHDADGRRLCGAPVVIGRTTAAELGRLRVGDHKIPRLRDLLQLVDGKVPLLLEVKVDGDRQRWISALREDLVDYNGSFGIMSFDPGLVRLVRMQEPTWRRGMVVADALPAWRRWLALSLAAPHFLAVETRAALRPWVTRLRTRLPVYCWTVRAAGQRLALQMHVDALIWEGDGRP